MNWSDVPCIVASRSCSAAGTPSLRHTVTGAAGGAREGVEVVAGWRGEVNVPGLTQVRPDLLVQVSEGALGTGTHYIEFERSAVLPGRVGEKLGPYHRMATTGRPLPLLVVCETDQGEENFRTGGRRLPMPTATQERAFAGPLTGPVTVWRRDGVPAALDCR